MLIRFGFQKFLLDEKKEGEAGGAPDLAKENAALKAELEKLKASAKPDDKKQDEPDLKEKARREQEEKDKTSNDRKSLEGAVRFNMGAKDFLKNNASLLPKDVGGIFDTAEKETYDSEVEKTRSIKSALIQSFFAVQANVDQLTGSQKTKLDDYLKLTVKMKHERAEEFYDNIFEPTLENVRKIKKAEALKSGYQDNSEDALKNKMLKTGLAHYNVKEKQQNA